jgi:hypothetical protein
MSILKIQMDLFMNVPRDSNGKLLTYKDSDG